MISTETRLKLAEEAKDGKYLYLVLVDVVHRDTSLKYWELFNDPFEAAKKVKDINKEKEFCVYDHEWATLVRVEKVVV